MFLNNFRLKQIRPLLDNFITVQEITSENKYILSHPNGAKVNDIIVKKLKEEVDTPVPAEIQGQVGPCQFDYDKVHLATLNANDPNLEQKVVVLNASSPTNIYVCPIDQIGVAETIAEKVLAYAKIDENMTGFAPGFGKMCLAKSLEDGEWYRGACIEIIDDKFKIFFVDYGFKEILPREQLKMIDPHLMETLFLANHCILQGFENAELAHIYEEKYSNVIEERLPFATEVKLKVIKQDPDHGYFIVKMHPEVKLNINPEVIQKPSEEEEEKIRKIKELEAQLSMLRMNS